MQSPSLQHVNPTFRKEIPASRVFEDVWQQVNASRLVSVASSLSYNYGFMIALVDEGILISQAFNTDLNGNMDLTERPRREARVHFEQWCLAQLFHHIQATTRKDMVESMRTN
eukprot:m.923359 g.923359  ORF g.923359 m.923359 type:complete len:113 (-) comp109251_c0_seq1:282-620(-)